MRITINGQVKILPSSLSEITLGQRIDYTNEYGRALDERLKAILDMPEGIDRELATIDFQVDKCFQTVAFFTGCTPAALKSCAFVDEVTALYYGCLRVLLEEESELTFSPDNTYLWHDERWTLHPPVIGPGDKMTFGEFVDSKQIVKDLHNLGRGRFEALQRLCAIYLRREGEAYDEAFSRPDSDRVKLMRLLPMDIALVVGFFLSSSMNFFLNTLAFSSPDGESPEAGKLKSTSTAGGG